MEPGLYQNISSDVYHSGPGVSKSDLALILRSPAHFKAKDAKKETPALLFGSAFHEAILEPDNFAAHWHVTDKKTIKPGLLPQDDYDNIQAMRAHLMAHETAWELLTGDVETELSAFWKDPVYDVLCKARLDALNKGKQVIVDLKTCLDAREHAIIRDAYKYGWHMQAFWYTYALQILTKAPHEFYFIAIEKEPPFAVAVYKASEDFIQEGGIQCQKALAICADCLEKDEWPGYEAEVKSLELPGWVKLKTKNTPFVSDSIIFD